MKNFSGKGVKIALIDSGVSEHNALNINKAISLIDETLTDKAIGHGTQMAGIIKGDSPVYQGLAPKVELVSIK